VGQRQRVALAKTLLSPRPLIILDEPTAHLDALTETHILASITELKERGATVIVVAHRPSVVSLADQVVEVDSQTTTPPAGAAPIPVAGATSTESGVL